MDKVLWPWCCSHSPLSLFLPYLLLQAASSLYLRLRLSSRSSSLSLPCVRGSRHSSSHDYLLDLVEKEEPRGKITRLGSGSSDAGRGRAQQLLQVVGAVVGVAWGAALASSDGERVCCQPAKVSDSPSDICHIPGSIEAPAISNQSR